MRVVVQKVKKASVTINNEVYNKIDEGLVVFSCFTMEDTIEDIDYIVRKITNLRIFDDENHVMNKSVIDVKGSILSISQFTLYAITCNGNRPSYTRALNGEDATKLYDIFNEKLNNIVNTYPGIFGSDMLVSIENNGPTTIIIDSKNKNL